MELCCQTLQLSGDIGKVEITIPGRIKIQCDDIRIFKPQITLTAVGRKRRGTRRIFPMADIHHAQDHGNCRFHITGAFVQETMNAQGRMIERIADREDQLFRQSIQKTGIFQFVFRISPRKRFFPQTMIPSRSPENQLFDYRWLSIDGPNAGMRFKSLGYEKGLLSAGDCPEDLFLRMERFMENDIKEFQLKALNTAFEILTMALVPKGNTRPIIEQIREFIDENYHDSGVHINMLAEAFRIHRVSLNRLFQQKYGISPIQYLTSVRIRQGIRLLCSTEDTVKEIAFRCGYNSADYFSKCIFKQTGMLPEALRKKGFTAFPLYNIRTAEVPDGRGSPIRLSGKVRAGADRTTRP